MPIARSNVGLAGVLVFAGIGAGLLSVAPAVDSADYLAEAARQPMRVRIGAAGQMVMAFCQLGFAVLLYPVVRRFGETLSLGFLGFRIVAAAVAVVATVVLLAILELSRQAGALHPDDPAAIMAVGETLRLARDQLNHVFMVVALSAGNAMLFLVTFRSRLLPAWLSVWGMAGAFLSAGASVAVLFDRIGIITAEYIALNLPTATSELVLGAWLVVRGLRPAPGRGTA